MRDDLLSYYEKELDFLREMGVEFKQRYPLEAKRLALEPNKCEDPHVERMIEAFAFLAARVHMRLDDDFPEITEALLHILYPHYLRPIPSMSVVQMEIDPDQLKPDAGLTIPRGARLDSPPVDGLPCKFRTCFDVTFWPIEVTNAQWAGAGTAAFGAHVSEAAAAVTLGLRCRGELTFSQLALSSLRLYLSGQGGLVHDLYELLCNNCILILASDRAKPNAAPVVLQADALRPAGFEDNEALLPYSRRSFSGYRLLQEYFCFPEKFLFLDLYGFEQIRRAGFGAAVDITFVLAPFEREDRKQRLELGISKTTFRLACTPIVNLFERPAEPVLVNHATYEQAINPDVYTHEKIRIFSVDDVVTINPQKQETVHFLPFFSYRHGAATEAEQAFWYASRRTLGNRDAAGPEVYVVLVDLTGKPKAPNVDVLHVHTTCMNGDLPSRLHEGDEFQLQGAAPVKRVATLMVPTKAMEPPVAAQSAWKFISHFSLNYLSLVGEGKEALQAILRLYNFNNSPESERQVEGIVELDSKRHSARIVADEVLFARGVRVKITFNEQNYAGAGVYLFASVLERFLGTYVTLNSFSQLVARTKGGRGILKTWAPRSGQKILA